MFNDRRFPRWAATALALGWLGQAGAQANTPIVDRDSDGLIEINNLDDLNEIRNDLLGRTLRGSNAGCPNSSCYGYELARDLDFDTNGNGSLDAEDWNFGRPWTPIQGTTRDVPLDQNRFRATFVGNGHAIRNMRLRRITNVLDYGLFGSVTGATIRSLRLLKVDANIQAQASADVGGLAGRAFAQSWLHAVTVEGDVASDTESSVAGLVGTVHDTTISYCSFSGEAVNLFHQGSSNANVAGLVGEAQKTLILGSHARGRVAGTHVGGLVETSFQTGIRDSFANVDIEASLSGGGLMNRAYYRRAGIPEEIRDNPDYYTLRNVMALGSISTEASMGGGLVSSLAFEDDVIVRIENSYARNLITNTVDDSQWANLVHSVDGDALVVKHSYWVMDPAGAILPSNSDLTTGGQLLADMQCATPSAIPGANEGCAQPRLFIRWTDGVWNFGTASELPTPANPLEYRWLSADSPNATGDHESLSALRTKFPDATCDTPLALYAKEKNSGYVFRATNTDEVLEIFSGRQGLSCKNAQQPDGACGDYQVRYLCDETAASGTVRWTNWSNRDTPTTGEGDDESLTNQQICSTGAPVGIEAGADGQTFRIGPPRKLAAFSVTRGLKCLNSDGACKDFQVRMVCSVAGDR